MSRMTKFDRARAIGLLQSGLSMAKVARQMKVAKSSISRLASKVRKVGNERALKNLPGQGRKPKATLGDWKRIVRMVKKNPFITALKIKLLVFCWIQIDGKRPVSFRFFKHF